MQKDSNLYEKIRTVTSRQANAWKIFGKSVPLIVLSVFCLLHVFGFNTLSEQLLVVGGAFFFAVACVWWWWAINVMVQVANLMTRATEKFEEVKDDIVDVKKEIKSRTKKSNKK